MVLPLLLLLIITMLKMLFVNVMEKNFSDVESPLNGLEDHVKQIKKQIRILVFDVDSKAIGHANVLNIVEEVHHRIAVVLVLAVALVVVLVHLHGNVNELDLLRVADLVRIPVIVVLRVVIESIAEAVLAVVLVIADVLAVHLTHLAGVGIDLHHDLEADQSLRVAHEVVQHQSLAVDHHHLVKLMKNHRINRLRKYQATAQRNEWKAG